MFKSELEVEECDATGVPFLTAVGYKKIITTTKKDN